MGFVSDMRVLYHLAFAKVKGNSHGERLEAFYSQQSGAYDDFRKRLLHGREEMMRALDLPEGGRMLDMGGGTGSNLEQLSDRIGRLSRVEIVDLCPSLLRVADERIAQALEQRLHYFG